MLAEDKRTQLDGIVQQMTRNNEPFNNIQMVVNDFKQKYDTPPAPTQDTNQPGFLKKATNFVFGGVPQLENQIPGMSQIATGAGKSLLGLAGEVTELAGKGVGLVAPQTGQKIQEFGQGLSQKAQTQSLLEGVGKVGGDIAQFFLPGGLETKAIQRLDKVIDIAKFAEKFGPQAGETLNNILKVIGSSAVKGASTGAVQELQTGGQSGAGAAVAGGIAGGLGKALEIFGPQISQSLIKSGFKLSPQGEVKLGQKAQDAASFMEKNKILGSDTSKFRKVSQLNQKLEQTLQDSLGKNEFVSTADIKKELDTIPTQFQDKGAIYDSVLKDVEDAKKSLDARYPKGEINLNSVLTNKRSYGESAFGKASAIPKGSLVRSEGDFAIEQAYENSLDKALTNLKGDIKIPKALQSSFGGKTTATYKEFNDVYSQAINAKKLTNIAQFKKDSGLVGRLFGLWAGKTAGYALTGGLGGEIIGGALGEMAASKGAQLGRIGMEKAVSSPAFASGAVKVGTPLITGISGNNQNTDQSQ